MIKAANTYAEGEEAGGVVKVLWGVVEEHALAHAVALAGGARELEGGVHRVHLRRA